MTDARERLLCESELGFCCAITASLSHEINNVLAIVNELSGLLDDFFAATEQGSPLDVEKLKGTTRRIAGQVERGREYVRQLNHFAHTVDGRQGELAVNETVEIVATLCRRFGALRRVEIRTNLTGASPVIEVGKFELQHLVFRCIDLVLTASGEGDVVQIDTERHKDGVRLIVKNRSALKSAAELESKRSVLAALVAEMNGVAESTIADGQSVRLEISLPQSANGRGRKT